MYVQSNAASRTFLKLFMETLRKGDFEAAKTRRRPPTARAMWPWC